MPMNDFVIKIYKAVESNGENFFGQMNKMTSIAPFLWNAFKIAPIL